MTPKNINKTPEVVIQFIKPVIEEMFHLDRKVYRDFQQQKCRVQSAIVQKMIGSSRELRGCHCALTS